MPTFPRYFISNRWDQLGGRLVPLLNALNLAKRTGSKVLFTWRRDHLVGDISEIFSGEFCAPFNPDTSAGCVLPEAQLSGMLWSDEVQTIISDRRPDADNSIENWEGVVRPKFDPNPNVAYVFNRRFATYQLDVEYCERESSLDFGRVFQSIPKNAQIADAFEVIDKLIPAGRYVAIHARRAHLLSDTPHQRNRFESYCSDTVFESLISRLSYAKFDKILIGCDSKLFVTEFRRVFPNHLLALSDLMDLSRFTVLQTSLLDMYFISRAAEIYAPLSAFSFCAAMLGGAKFTNILIYAARQNLPGADPTGAISFYRARARGRAQELARHIAPGSDTAALYWNLAQLLRRSDGNRDLASQLAAKALALRFVEYPAADLGDTREFCRQCIGLLGTTPEYQSTLHTLNEAMETRSLTSLAKLVDEVRRLAFDAGDTISRWLRIASWALVGEISALNCLPDEALQAYRLCRELAAAMGLAARGIEMRIAAVHHCAADCEKEVEALKAAVACDPCLACTHYLLGRAFERAGKIEDADREYHQATVLERDDGQPWFARALLARSGGRLKAAIGYIEAALGCDPMNAGWRKTLEDLHGSFDATEGECGAGATRSIEISEQH